MKSRKAKGYKSFDFKIEMKVLVKYNKKQGRKGSRLEEDWLGPYDIHSILDNCVKVSRNGKVIENKIAVIHIKPYISPSVAEKPAQLLTKYCCHQLLEIPLLCLIFQNP